MREGERKWEKEKQKVRDKESQSERLKERRKEKKQWELERKRVRKCERLSVWVKIRESKHYVRLLCVLLIIVFNFQALSTLIL